MKIRNRCPRHNSAALPLFAWADAREFRPFLTYPARRLRQRFPHLSPSQANLYADLAGFGICRD